MSRARLASRLLGAAIGLGLVAAAIANLHGAGRASGGSAPAKLYTERLPR